MLKFLLILITLLTITFFILRKLIKDIIEANKRLLASEALATRMKFRDLFIFMFDLPHPSHKGKYDAYIVKDDFYRFKKVLIVLCFPASFYITWFLHDSFVYSSVSRLWGVMCKFMFYMFPCGFSTPESFRLISYAQEAYTHQEILLGYIWLIILFYFIGLIFFIPLFIRVRNLFFQPFITKARDEEKAKAKKNKQKG